jgi:hypothetical protein
MKIYLNNHFGQIFINIVLFTSWNKITFINNHCFIIFILLLFDNNLIIFRWWWWERIFSIDYNYLTCLINISLRNIISISLKFILEKDFWLFFYIFTGNHNNKKLLRDYDQTYSYEVYVEKMIDKQSISFLDATEKITGWMKRHFLLKSYAWGRETSIRTYSSTSWMTKFWMYQLQLS